MRKYRELWRRALAEALTDIAGAAGAGPVSPESLVAEIPPKPELGDIAFPLFPFAKILRKAPAAIAQEAARVLSTRPGVPAGTAEAAGPYVNVRLDQTAVLADVLGEVEAAGESYGRTSDMGGERILLEFSCPNTNKPLHLGHLRNDAIGESLSRILAAAGATVRKVNLINDRGVHICKSMLAYRLFGGTRTPAGDGVKGDHFVGEFYVRYAQHEKEHPEAEEQVRELLLKWEEGDAETRALWRTMNDWVISGIEQTYRRTGIAFDQVYLESDVYTLGRSVILEGIGKGLFQKDPDGSVWVDLTAQGLDREVLLRGDGTSLYLTQDIGLAIQRSRDWPFQRLVYVVGSEQRYHFRVLFQVLTLLGHPWAGSLHHLAYGMVNLPEGKMKSREGTVVDADELIDELAGLAREEITGKEREGDVADLDRTAEEIALGALNYWLLQVTPVKDMTFDPKESISFNGNTGPYLQYTGARISSMLRKYEERKASFAGGSFRPELLALPEEWEVVKAIAFFPEAVSQAGRELNPSVLAGYLFELSKNFSRYYQDHPVLRNEDKDLVVSRIALVRAVVRTVRNGLTLLGIPFLEAM
jgi:arginyl-tRNA synthetase